MNAAPRTTPLRLLVVPLLTITAFGCGEPDRDAPDPGQPGATAPNTPRWTLDPLWTSSDTLLLSGVSQLAVDSRDRLYAYDRDAGLVLFSPGGDAVRRLGREGEGPGEYRWVAGLQVIAGDTLMVWDPRLGRLSVFEPDSGRFVHDRSFGRRAPASRARFAPPRWIHRVRTGPERYVAVNAPLTRPDAEEVDRRWVVRLLDADGGIVRDSVLVFPSGTSVTIQQESGFTSFVHPFGAEGIVRIGPGDRIHYAHTDTARIRIFDLQGREVGGFDLPRQRFPVTDEDIEEFIEILTSDDRFVDMADGVADGLRKLAPERHPLFHDFLVDDRGRVWIPEPRHRASPDRSLEWEIFSAEGRLLGVVPVERGALRAVRGDRVYGVVVDSLGVPVVWAATVRERNGLPSSRSEP